VSTAHVPFADLLTPDGWAMRAIEEARAGRATIGAVTCPDCLGVFMSLERGRSRAVDEFGARPCACGNTVTTAEWFATHGIPATYWIGRKGERSD